MFISCYSRISDSLFYHPLDLPTPPPSVDDAICPDKTWIKHGEYCYYFSGYTTISWENADSTCSDMADLFVSSSLVSIHSMAENIWLASTAIAQGHTTNYGTWTGLNRHGDCEYNPLPSLI